MPHSMVYTLLAVLTGVALPVFSASAAQLWKPSRNIEIIVPSGPGGAADRQGRVTQTLLQTVPGMPAIVISNRPGGGGNLGYTALAQMNGDGHVISTMATSLLTNHIVGVSQVHYTDVTPLNIMLREYVIAWVRKDSPLASAGDLAARLKQNPASVSFAFSTARGNQNHVLIGMLARAVGVDPKILKIVVYSSGGQGMTAALGGHVDVWVGTAGGAIPHMQSGAARILGISSPERLAGPLAATPTFREQGIDAQYFAWRGFAGARGLAPAQTAFWDDAFGRIMKSDAYRKILEENGWAEGFSGAAETRKHLDLEYEMLKKMLPELGVVPTK